MTRRFIAQSIVHAHRFWGNNFTNGNDFRLCIIEHIVCYYGLVHHPKTVIQKVFFISELLIIV